MRGIVLANVILAVACLTGSAFGYLSDPTIVTWQDDFEGAAVGQGPSQMPGWTGSSDNAGTQPGPWPNGWQVIDDGGNKVVRDRIATSANSAYTYAWTNSPLGLGLYDLQVLHFKGKLAALGSTGQRQQQVIFQFVDGTGNPIAG